MDSDQAACKTSSLIFSQWCHFSQATHHAAGGVAGKHCNGREVVCSTVALEDLPAVYTMSAERLNSISILHVHKNLTDSIDVAEVCKNFVTANDNSKLFFGIWAFLLLSAYLCHFHS